ncbi:protein kinase [bacterium]|nr:protein kinase [bacterium]
MNKSIFVGLSVLFWIALALAVLASKGSIDAQWGGEDDTMLMVVYVVIGAGFLGGILVNTMLADKLFVASILEGGVDKIPLAQRQKIAEKQAKAALTAGRPREAIAAYETAGLIDQALALAQEKGEHAQAARLFLKVGRKDHARKAAIRAGDHLLAGHLSLALKDFNMARDEYALHVAGLPESFKPIERAKLLDRAGRYGEAAAIYSSHGDFIRAADSWLLAQAPEQAAAAREKASVLLAVERGRESNSSQSVRTRLIRDGDVAKEQGDLFHAAWCYREAGSPRTAGEVFEGIEEWVRAASCYEQAGENAKAQLMWAKAEESLIKAPPPPPMTVSMTQDTGPFPSSQRPGQRAAVGSAQAPPSGASSSGGPPPPFGPPSANPPKSPWKPLDPKTAPPSVVVPNSYMQAANLRQTPQTTEGWRDVAKTLALSGNLKGAADVHLQCGDLGEAVSCLVDAGQPREAAMLALGGGDYAKAAELLVDQIDAGVRGDIGELLGQILINLKEFELADQLLRKRLAPKINQESAGVVFQFARMFEDGGALIQAECLYEDLVKSGATSGELEACLRSVRRRLSSEDGASSRTGTQSGLLTSQIRRKLNAWDFIQAAIADSDDMVPKPTSEAVEKPTAPTMRPYAFTPPKPSSTTIELPMRELPTSELTAAPTKQTKPPKPRHQVTMLGSASIGAERKTGMPEDPFNIPERYRLDREVGRGGMGMVYQAHDLLLDRPVGLKVLHSFGSTGDSLRQFMLEARAIARLNHQNVVRVFDMGVMDLQHYIAMELVTGGDLRSHITKAGRLSCRDALKYLVQIAEGLGAAHRAGIVHRDIKPGNVLLTDDLNVRIVDFGLAKLETPGDGDEPTMFRFAGTPGFMAPEQIRGESAGPPADIYALGITLFQMLVGSAPHRAMKLTSAEQAVEMTMAGKLPPLPEFCPGVPPAIEQLYRYCTATDVAERFQQVDDFLPSARKWMEAL